MKSQSFNILTLLVFTLLTKNILADCPIQEYPSECVIGFIKAQINLDSQYHNQNQIYSYGLVEALSTTTPNVLIGINTLQMDMSSKLLYKVKFLPSPHFGTLLFQLFLNDQFILWRKFQFNFFATNNKDMIADTLSFENPVSKQNNTKLILSSMIKINQKMKIKPQIQSYISGISLKSLTTASDLQLSESNLLRAKKMQSLPQYTNLSKLIKQISLSQKMIYYQITSTILNNNNLMIQMSCSNYLKIFSVDVSYFIVNYIDFTTKANIILNSLTINNNVKQFKVITLNNRDMAFVGLRGIQHKLNYTINVDLLIDATTQDTYIANYYGFAPEFGAYANYFQVDLKYPYQCQNCPNSIYRYQKYCLDKCPRNYVNVNNGWNSSCKFCNITNYMVPNDNNSDCVCALQYFLSSPTRSCQPCLYSCLSCKASKTCLTCSDTLSPTFRILNKTSFKCICKDGYFDQIPKLTCQKCHSSCLTCNGQSMYECLKCATGRQFDSMWRCACATNFYQQDGICRCNAPKILVNGVCLTKQQNSCNFINHMVQLKHNGIITCVCDKNYTFFNGNCLSCPKSFVLNQNGICACPLKTNMDSKGNCISCNSMQHYDSRLERCLCKKSFHQAENGTCINCPNQSIYVNGNCRCVFNYYLLGNKCVKCQKTADSPNCLRFIQQL